MAFYKKVCIKFRCSDEIFACMAIECIFIWNFQFQNQFGKQVFEFASELGQIVPQRILHKPADHHFYRSHPWFELQTASFDHLSLKYEFLLRPRPATAKFQGLLHQRYVFLSEFFFKIKFVPRWSLSRDIVERGTNRLGLEKNAFELSMKNSRFNFKCSIEECWSFLSVSKIWKIDVREHHISECFKLH